MFLFRTRRFIQTKSFEELKVTQELVKRLELMGIHEASYIQQAMIPLFQSHVDILIKDKTGSGKTLGLCIGAVNKTVPSLSPNWQFKMQSNEQAEFVARRLKNKKYLATLFVVPTRELGLQIYNWILNLNPDYSDGTVQCVYAGVDIEKQKTSLQNIPTILIGTPNRLFDLYNSNSFDISRLQTLIVDEIDKIVEPLGKYSNVKQRFNKKIHPLVGELLLEMIISQRKIESKKTIGVGFLSDPAKSKPLQFIASSATVNNPLRNYLKKRKWTERPVLLDLNSNPPSEVQHLAYYFDQQGKIHQVSSDGCIKDIQLDETISGLEIIAEAIGSICHSHKVKRGMIVVPPSVSITTLVSHLQSIGLSAEKLFNLHDYNHQTKPFEALINGNVNLVCATETEIRGLDIPELDHVIIVGATNSQSYLHVSGRTGRFGRFGTCISLLPPKFVERYLKMLQLNGIKIKEPLPTPLKHEIVPSWF